MRHWRIVAALAALVAGVLCIVLAGCANMRPLPSRCPLCGWLLRVADNSVETHADGTRWAVITLQCLSAYCPGQVTVTYPE